VTGAALAPEEGYWFKSSKFQVEPGEDEETNPGLYGRQLARWLKARLETAATPLKTSSTKTGAGA
jgi:hypothetical protein